MKDWQRGNISAGNDRENVLFAHVLLNELLGVWSQTCVSQWRINIKASMSNWMIKSFIEFTVLARCLLDTWHRNDNASASYITLWHFSMQIGVPFMWNDTASGPAMGSDFSALRLCHSFWKDALGEGMVDMVGFYWEDCWEIRFPQKNCHSERPSNKWHPIARVHKLL